MKTPQEKMEELIKKIGMQAVEKLSINSLMEASDIHCPLTAVMERKIAETRGLK